MRIKDDEISETVQDRWNWEERGKKDQQLATITLAAHEAEMSRLNKTNRFLIVAWGICMLCTMAVILVMFISYASIETETQQMIITQSAQDSGQNTVSQNETH